MAGPYVSAAGEVVMAGGPTVKNVSGFDLCRLFVGARGTLGFIGSVILRTRPLPRHSQWFSIDTDRPTGLLRSLYKPVSILWNGTEARVLLEGAPDDVAEQAAMNGMSPVAGGWPLQGVRSSHAPGQIPAVVGPFLAQIGTGVIWTDERLPGEVGDDRRLAGLRAAVKQRFDPSGRLNPAELASG